MPGKVVLLLLGSLIFLSYHIADTGSPGTDITNLYKKANRLFNLPNPTDKTDSIALLTFQLVISQLEKKQVADTFLFQSYLKKGILLDVKSNYTGARDAYLRAIAVKRLNKGWSDSLIYPVYIYVGSAYYNLNHFDSANYYLLEAEELSRRFTGVPEKERLYNVLGALYYENGNYRQSSNYFNHALEILNKKKPYDTTSAINFENNMAVSFYRLGLYSEALAIYQKLLNHEILTSHIYVNMGKAFAAMGNYADALACFRKTNPREVPDVFNEIANIQLQLNRPDSAEYFLNRFSAHLIQDKNTPGNIDAGNNCLVRCDLLNRQQQYRQALTFLQKAIIIFSGNFSNNDIYKNPPGFTGTFASYKLFEALQKKAATFEQLYKSQGKEEYLQASFNTYQATISLLRYIEKSYDTDDAKIFLKKNSKNVYQEAFLVCLALHRLHPGGQFMEQGYLIAEKYKASVIVSHLTERTFKKIRGIDPRLIQKERNIKYNIARLNIKSDQLQNQAHLEVINREKANFEIELSQLQNQIERNSSYYKLKYDDAYPGIKQIQQYITPEQALVSLFATTTSLYAFVITRSSFHYARIDSLTDLKQHVESWITALKSTEAGRKFNKKETGAQLYQRLVQPIQALAPGKEEWIIIPDDILHFLPFESLPAENGPRTLLETTVTSYHFSSRFIVPQLAARQKKLSYNVLSFAPFAHKEISYSQARASFMNPLPASAAEITGLPGKQYVDKMATRKQFLENVNHFPIIHLATHAVADVNNSQGSFIAFYPGTGLPAEDRLYLDELYGLNMDATELVIISACETGNGKLISSEGVISLSRGFAYAGCASIINSLWKADDAATSAILKQFHVYLQKGYTKSKALQRAKLDYIRSNSLYKTPDYWAHLVLIGNTDAVVASKQWPVWYFIAGGLLTIAIFYVLYKKKNKVDVVL